MKKFKGLLFILVLSIFAVSCTSINEVFNTEKIPAGLSAKIKGKVSPTDIYALGNASTDNVGSLIAQAQATQNAQNILSSKLKNSIKTEMNVFLNKSDKYAQNIITPVMPDLINYATTLCVKNSIKKGEWAGENSVYSLVAINRTQVSQISKEVFTKYLSDLSNNLLNIKQKVDGTK